MPVHVVTGCAGFIGAHVAEALLRRGDDVVGVDALNDAYSVDMKHEALQRLQLISGESDGGRFTFIQGNLLDDDVRSQLWSHAPDVVVHLAARAGVRPSIEEPMLYHAENATVTAHLLDEARRQSPMPKFVLASSSSVYGERTEVPFAEDSNTDHPISPYAASKKACEVSAFTTHHLFGLSVFCLRFFTVYGPGQRPDLAIHKFAERLHNDEPIPRYGDGTTARDYTFVGDITDGVLRAIDRCEGYDILNLGSSRPVTLQTLIDKIGAAFGKTPVIDELPAQPGDVSITYADISRAEEVLGYRPQTSLDDGLQAFADWFMQRKVR